MHLNSFNKLVKYLLETNEGVYRYSDITSIPQDSRETAYLKIVYTPVTDSAKSGSTEIISKQEYDAAKNRALKIQAAVHPFSILQAYVHEDEFTIHEEDGTSINYAKNTKTFNVNRRLFNSKNYIKTLEQTLNKHLKHKIAIFLNDVEDNSITIEIPGDVIGLEVSMLSLDDRDLSDEINAAVGVTMLTPWMVGHRLGHQLFNVSFVNGRYIEPKQKSQILDILLNLLKKYNIGRSIKAISRDGKDFILDYIVAKKMFNFKSLRDLSSSNDHESYMMGEFYNELFAQYAKYGKVTIHYPGTPEERADTARQIEQVFSNWLDTLKGRVTNIDE